MENTQEVELFKVTDAVISDLKEKYMVLKINGIDDKAGYKTVKAARLDIKSYRVEVDKKRKELTADALKHQRRINSEAARVTNLLESIEDHLSSQEKAIDDEIAEIKKEKEVQEALRIHKRIEKLLNAGFVFNGIDYKAHYNEETRIIAASDIKSRTDKEFDSFIEDAMFFHEAHLLNLKQLEEERIEQLRIRDEEISRQQEALRIEREAIKKLKADQELAEKQVREQLEIEQKAFNKLKEEQEISEKIARKKLELEQEALNEEKMLLDKQKEMKEEILLATIGIPFCLEKNSIPIEVFPETEFAEVAEADQLIITEEYTDLGDYDEIYKITITKEDKILSEISGSDDLCNYPQDATLSKDLKCIFEAINFFKIGYEAGKSNQKVCYKTKCFDSYFKEITIEEYEKITGMIRNFKKDMK